MASRGWDGFRMVFVSGLPAVGKATVAAELARRLGYVLWDNHVMVDALLKLFPFGSPEFTELRERFWLEVFGKAAGAWVRRQVLHEGTLAAGTPGAARAPAEGGSDGGSDGGSESKGGAADGGSGPFAAGTTRGMVFTFAPETTVEAGFPKRVAEALRAGAHAEHVKLRGGGATPEAWLPRVSFVELTAPVDTIVARIDSASRRGTGKLRDPALLKKLVADGSVYALPASEYPAGAAVESFTTDGRDPAATADAIAAWVRAP